MDIALGEFLNWLIKLAGTGLVPAIVYLAKRYLDDSALEKFTPLVEDYIKKGVNKAESYLGSKAENATVEIQNQMIGKAVEFTLENAPKAVKKAGFTEKMLEEEATSLIKDLMK